MRVCFVTAYVCICAWISVSLSGHFVSLKFGFKRKMKRKLLQSHVDFRKILPPYFA